MILTFAKLPVRLDDSQTHTAHGEVQTTVLHTHTGRGGLDHPTDTNTRTHIAHILT